MLAYFSFLFLGFGLSQQSPVEDNNSTILQSNAREGRQYNSIRNSVEQFAEPIYKPHIATGYNYNQPSVTLISQQQQQQQFAPDNTLHIYFYQNKLSLYCATDTTYEKITWRKYTCPNLVGTTPGETVAAGAIVSNPNLYGVNSFGRNEEFVSELLLKQPLSPTSDGVYVCEGAFISDDHSQEAVTVVRDIVIIGGRGMYQNCFSSLVKYSLGIRRPTNSTNFFN